MNAVDKFNALNGAVVSRQEIKKILELANDQEQLFIAKRLKRLLESNPDDKEFELSLSERAIEVVPKSLLHCLDYEPENDDTDSQGLGRITPSDVYQMITDKMIEAIKAASGKEYKKTWKDGYLTDEKGEPMSGYLFPFNFITKKPYRGINILLLSQRKGLQILPMKNPFFMTFKQIESLGARIKKGAKGYPVVYFTILYKIKTDKLDFATYDKAKFIEYLLKNGYDQKEIGSIISNNHIPILRYYNVFNGEDIEGVDFDLDNFKIGKILPEIKGEKQERLEIAEQIIAHYPKPQPKIKEGNSDEAYYSPRTDLVRMPHFDSFDTAQDYYRTLFHELIHSTGHQSRLNRNFTGRFGSKEYAKEELVAEFGAVFLSAQAGIIWYSDKNHAEYIKNWHSVLGIIEEDNRFLMRAASDAQRATDFILQLDSEGVPLYQKQLEEKQKSSDSEGVATSKKTRGTKGDKKSNSTFKSSSKTEPVQVVRYFDRYAGLPFGQKGDIQTHGIPSTETGRMLRFGAELSDGSIVSLDGVVRRTKPEVWEAHKNYIASKKGANKNQAIIEKTMSYDEFKQYLDSLYETTLRNGSLVHRLSELKFYKNEFKGSLIDGLVNVDINIDGKKINPRSYFEAKYLEIDGNTKQKKNLTIADKVKEAEIEPINTSETSVNIESGLSNPTSKPKNPLVIPMVEEPPKDVKFFNIKGDFGKFLGNVEVKPIHSVAVTLDAPQGAGKTRFFYYIMNLFAEQGYRCLFVSLEEHPLSELAQQKKRQYISSKNFKLIDTVAELPNGYKDLEKLIPDYDVIFIDSWGKVTEIHRIDFDKSLRKKYNGKLFFVIFQRTVAGTMRGGSASQFDGDIIMKIEKSESGDFKENYAFFDKNRYQSIELDKLKFNTYSNKLIKETPKKEKENKEVQPKS